MEKIYFIGKNSCKFRAYEVKLQLCEILLLKNKYIFFYTKEHKIQPESYYMFGIKYTLKILTKNL